MAILYRDDYILCDEDGISIDWYYFPWGMKRIYYDQIEQIEEYGPDKFTFLTGKGKIWGMGLSAHWFGLDPKRPYKDKCIVIAEKDNWCRTVLTPDDHIKVWEILQQKTLL